MDEKLVSRAQPSNLDAEQAVIGAMIYDPKTVDEAADILVKEDFYYQQYGIIFEAILKLRSKNSEINLVTISDQLASSGVPDNINDVEHLKYLADSVPVPEDIKGYVDIVKNKSMLRNIIATNRSIENMCFSQESSVEEILDTTETKFLELLQRRGAADATPINEIVNNAMERIYEALEHKGGLTGISTGFIDLDNITSGLQKSDLILVAARPSMGKTAFALNIACHATLKNDISVAIFSLEMSQESLVTRLFSIDAGIDAKIIKTAELEDYDWQRLKESADNIAKSKLIIDESPSITMQEIKSKCRKYKQNNDIQLIIIDYLQLINTSGKSESRQQEISNISRNLKALARELDVPVVALSQLNRSVEQRDDKRPMLSDLRDSGAIEQDADVVMLLYRDEYYKKDESEEKGISEVIIAKQRNGPTGTIKLKWMSKYTRFANLNKARNKVSDFD